MKKMQWMIIFPAILLITGLCNAQTLLYLAEPKTEAQQMETRIVFYHADAKQEKEIYVKGMLPKLSPGGKYAAFVRPHEKYEEHYELCVSDQEGKTQQILVFMCDMRNMPVYVWSPKGDKVAVSQLRERISGNRKKSGIQSRVLIFDFVQAKVTQVHDRLIQTHKETVPADLQWFPDNVHLLVSGHGETLIADTVQNTSQNICSDAIRAFVASDGKKIIAISSPEKWMFDIWQYDVQTQKKEKLHTLQFYAPDSGQWVPLMFARYSLLSHDSRYLLLRNPAGRSPAYILTDIAAKKNLPLDMKEKNPVFQHFSPTDSRMVSLIYVGGEGSYGGYGIFDTEKNEMKIIREMNAEIFHAGMAGFFLLQMSGADWIQTEAKEADISIDSKLQWKVPPDRIKREHPASNAKMLWKFKTEGVWVHSGPAVNEKTVYFTGTDTCCYALDRASGTEKWRYKTGHDITSAPVADKGSVYLCAKNSLYALNAETGTEKWIFKPDENARIYSAPVIKDGTVYCAAGDVLYAVNGDSGKEISRFKAEKQIRTSPVFADTVAYFSAEDFLYAIDSRNAKEIWKKKIPGIRVTPLVEKDMLYFGSGATDFSASDRKTGEEKWKFAADGFVYSRPCFAHGTVYFGSDDGNFYALDADSGKEKWRFGDSAGIEIRSSSLVIGDTVYFGSGDGYVYGLDIRDGKEKWNFNAKSTIETPLVLSDGILYFGAGSSVFAVAVE